MKKKVALVSPAKIIAGERLTKLLRPRLFRPNSNVRLEASFWWREHGRWRLIMATPFAHLEGKPEALKRVRAAIAEDQLPEFEPALEDLEVVSPSSGLITVLDSAPRKFLRLDRFAIDEAFGDLWVKGAYIYYFRPKTFIRA